MTTHSSSLFKVYALLLVFNAQCLTPVSSQVLQKIRQQVAGFFDKEPKPSVVDDFVSPEEAAILLERYKPLLRDSLHYVSSTQNAKSQYRTSKSVRLPPLGDPLVLEIEARSAALANVPHHQVEDFQLACYGVDELYGLHRDDTDAVSGGNKQASMSADRAATVLIYLQSPESGGATLFTRRALEEEHDIDTKRPLNTEAGALKLFRHYCDKPERKFVVVEPEVGRAVTWPNWYHKNASQHNQTKPQAPPLDIFCRKSTHGACPVVQGEKCVIQQWIRKSKPQPLRDPRLLALFPLHVDASFTEKLQQEASMPSLPSSCLPDIGTNQGRWIPNICFEGSFERRDQGPYDHLGSIHIRGGMQAALPSTLLGKESPGMTISFWGRISSRVEDNISNRGDEKTLISLGNVSFKTTATHTGTDPTSITLWIDQEPDTQSISPSFPSYNALDWLWFSVTVEPSEDMTTLVLSVYSKLADLLATLSSKVPSVSIMNGDSCDVDDNVEFVDLKLFVPPEISLSLVLEEEQHATTESEDSSTERKTAFITKGADGSSDRLSETKMAFVSAGAKPEAKQQPPQGSDVSFLLFHEGVLDQEEIVKLRHEAKRYDINT